MLAPIVAFAFAAATTLLLVRSAHLHAHRSADRDFSKPQKFHAVSVPRIGGLGVVLGLLAACLVVALAQGEQPAIWMLKLLACAAPAFLAGFVQDMTESVTPRGRLLAAVLSAALAFVWLDAAVISTDIPGLDDLIKWSAASFALTLLAVSGIANSINIIDGFNGLAGVCAALMLAAVAYVAFQVGDPLVGTMALCCIGAALGFLLWNYPSGHIFLGDGGAYCLGFLLAELNVLLLWRNPGEVSPLFPLLVCIYPVFETVFSIYRRKVLRRVPVSMPDGIHLHSLIYRRMVRWTIAGDSAEALTRGNSRTSPSLWLLCALPLVPAVLFYESTRVVVGSLFLFMATYLVLYWRIVRFHSPRWLRSFVGRPLPLPQPQER